MFAGGALIKVQAPMKRVLLATLPCIGGAVYFFGWRSLAVILVSCAAGFAAEYVFCRRRKEPVTQAVFVTAVLYALVMPPTIPWHILVIGIVFAVVFSKEVFGGFGRNIFNPAVAGRCFVYICFPRAMTSIWAPAAEGPWGALGTWTTGVPEAITTATPMALMKEGAFTPETADLLFGFLLGRIGGTMGVTSALLILIGGLYLFVTKTANRTVIITMIAVYALLTQGFHMMGVHPVSPVLPALLGGGFLFGVFFMATDPISSASTPWGRFYYAALIAVCTFIIRNFSIFNGGLMFAILIGNMFAPIIDHAVKAVQSRNKGQGGQA